MSDSADTLTLTLTPHGYTLNAATLEWPVEGDVTVGLAPGNIAELMTMAIPHLDVDNIFLQQRTSAEAPNRRNVYLPGERSWHEVAQRLDTMFNHIAHTQLGICTSVVIKTEVTQSPSQ